MVLEMRIKYPHRAFELTKHDSQLTMNITE